MSKKILKLTMLAILAILASGCSATYRTEVVPNNSQNNISIKVDQDATNWEYTGSADVMRVNYKYAYGVAAKTTLDKGFKYFSIYWPKDLVKQLKIRKVTNVKEAYAACDSGDGSFRRYLSVENFKGCNSLVFTKRESSFNGGATHKYIQMSFTMGNKDKKDNITFNAKEVLESDFMKDLNPAYFVNMER